MSTTITTLCDSQIIKLANFSSPLSFVLTYNICLQSFSSTGHNPSRISQQAGRTNEDSFERPAPQSTEERQRECEHRSRPQQDRDMLATNPQAVMNHALCT